MVFFFVNNLKTDENLVYPLVFLTHPRLGTTDLFYFLTDDLSVILFHISSIKKVVGTKFYPYVFFDIEFTDVLMGPEIFELR